MTLRGCGRITLSGIRNSAANLFCVGFHVVAHFGSMKVQMSKFVSDCEALAVGWQ